MNAQWYFCTDRIFSWCPAFYCLCILLRWFLSWSLKMLHWSLNVEKHCSPVIRFYKYRSSSLLRGALHVLLLNLSILVSVCYQDFHLWNGLEFFILEDTSKYALKKKNSNHLGCEDARWCKHCLEVQHQIILKYEKNTYWSCKTVKNRSSSRLSRKGVNTVLL